MKKRYYYAFGIFAVLFIAIACTKEITEDLVFTPYEIEVNNAAELVAYVDLPLSTTVKIKTEEAIESGGYLIKYQITEGFGYFEDDAQKIPENEFVKLTGAENTIYFVGAKEGVSKVTITVKDKFGREKTAILIYNVIDAGYIFDVVPSSKATHVGGFIDLNMKITESKPSTYQTKYSIVTTDPGAVLEMSFNGAPIAPDTYIDTEIGDFTWKFKGVSEGKVDIVMTTKSAFQIVVEKELSLTITIFQDTEIPIITLNGLETATLNVGEIYTELATASDVIDGDISSEIVFDGTFVNTDLPGVFTRTYNVKDAAGNAAVEKIRTITIVDNVVPVIVLNGSNPINVNMNALYTEAATASDNIDGNITASITFGGSYTSTSLVGTYTRTYDVKDAAGNSAIQRTRTIIVKDNIAPVIALNGTSTISVYQNSVYNDLATADDNIDGNITASIIYGGNFVNTATLGTFNRTYNVKDAAGNAASQLTRTIIVKKKVVVETCDCPPGTRPCEPYPVCNCIGGTESCP